MPDAKWTKTLNELYNYIVISLICDTNLPFDQRKRFEQVMIHFEPEFYEEAYLPLLNGNAEPLIAETFRLKKEREKRALNIFEEPDRNLLMAQKRKRPKRHNLPQTAKVLEVPRQTIYYWVKKKWVRPKRDFKNYPIFTVRDIEGMLKWRDKIRIEKIRRKRTVRLYDKSIIDNNSIHNVL